MQNPADQAATTGSIAIPRICRNLTNGTSRNCQCRADGFRDVMREGRMDRRGFLKDAAGAVAAAAVSGRAAADELPLGPLPGTRYPDPRIEALDRRFPKIGNAGIERVATGFRWCEGPVYVRDGG